MGIYEKLLKIQTELSVAKGHHNDFGNFNYRSCEDIQEAVKPLLKELNAVLKTGDEIVNIGNRFYVKATAELIDCESGEKVENTAYAREDEQKPKMDGSQVTGSSSSYARKYALNGLFCLDDVKDADAGNSSQNGGNRDRKGGNKDGNRGEQKPAGGSVNQKENPGSGKKLDEKSYNALLQELKRTGYRTNAIVRSYNVSSLKDLDDVCYKDAMEMLKHLPDKDEEPKAISFEEAMKNFPPDGYKGFMD